MSMTLLRRTEYNEAMRAQPRKDQLLATAFRLFNQQGYHATGIDQILAESGVAKATLYKYFPSKEDLILAVLERRHAELAAHLQNAIAKQSGQAKVLAVYDALDAWFNTDSFQGCNFIHASAEYADPEHPIHRYAAEHKRWLRDVLKMSLAEMNQASWADALLMLADGAIVAAQVRGDLNAAKLARQAAERLLVS